MPTFDLTCRCGTVIHTSDEHAGRTIRCRCGQTVLIQRPVVPPREDSRTSRAAAPRSDAGARRLGPSIGARLATGARHALQAPWRELNSSRTSTRWWARAQALYLVCVLLSAAALPLLSERWLPMTLLAYGPRLTVLLPIVLLLPLGLARARAALVFTLVGAFVALGPVMGYRFGSGPRHVPARVEGSSDAELRIVTFNAMGGERLQTNLSMLLERWVPDVVLLQECGSSLTRLVRAIPDWHVAVHQGLCTMSRWPLADVDSMPREDLRDLARMGYGGTGVAMRYSVAHPVHPFSVVNVHLETARRGLRTILGSDGLLPNDLALPDRLPFTQGRERAVINAIIRDRESERASSWTRSASAEPSRIVVAGDFNLPVESSIYRRQWSGFVNAFDAVGRGFGYTKLEGRWLRIRIDHVLLSPQMATIQGAWVDTDVGSDHRPLIVDLRLPSTPTGAADSGSVD
jgi:vancomycin resistance protein VanJ